MTTLLIAAVAAVSVAGMLLMSAALPIRALSRSL